MTVWLVVVAVAVVSAAMKAAGPVVLQDRTFPPRTAAVIDALAPAVLAGLVVVALLGQRWEAADATVLPGLAVAVGLRLRTRCPEFVCVAAAVIVTVGVRWAAG